MTDRRTVLLVLRVLASVVMLGVLIPRIDLSSVLPELTRTNVLWMLGALAATAGAFVLAAVRWQAVLEAMGIQAPVRVLLHHYVAGMFVGNFLPSTIGGDVLRVRRLSADYGRGADIFASVVLERLTGWLVLPVLTLVALAANPGLRELGGATALAAGIAIGTLVALSAVLFLVAHPQVGGRFAGTAGWRRFGGAIHTGLHQVRRHPGASIGVVATGIAYQATVVFAVFLAARALDIDHIGLTAVFAFFPAVAILQVLPISLGGLGIREWALVFFFRPLEVPDGRAVGLGLLVYALILTVSLLGAPSFAFGAGTKPDPVPSSP